jgi:membrane protease YdiL (CAAX protease family)
MVLAVFVLTVGWNLLQLGFTTPILIGRPGEETAYRSYLPPRISEVFGQSRACSLRQSAFFLPSSR